MISELSIVDIVKILWKKFWIIILCGVVSAAVVFSYSQFFIAPQYVATATIIVRSSSQAQTNTNASLTDINAAQRLVGSYSVVLKSKYALDKVIQQSGLSYTASQLQSMISLQALQESEVMQISVKGKNKDDIIVIANTMLDIAPGVLKEIVEIGSAKPVDGADYSTKVSPNVTLNTIIALLIGLFGSTAIILILALMDQSIKDEDDITVHYTVAVLGGVPDFSSNGKGGRK